MRQYAVLSVVLTAVLTAAGCSSQAELVTDVKPQAVVQPLFGTLYSNIPQPQRIVIRDPDTWAQLWAGMVSSGAAPATAPTIDFTREDVVVAAMGERRVAGYTIRIADVTETGNALRVDVASTVPGRGCNGADVITTPLDAVRIPKTAQPVQFNERTVVLACP